jgi:exosortase
MQDSTEGKPEKKKNPFQLDLKTFPAKRKSVPQPDPVKQEPVESAPVSLPEPVSQHPQPVLPESDALPVQPATVQPVISRPVPQEPPQPVTPPSVSPPLSASASSPVPPQPPLEPSRSAPQEITFQLPSFPPLMGVPAQEMQETETIEENARPQDKEVYYNPSERKSTAVTPSEPPVKSRTSETPLTEEQEDLTDSPETFHTAGFFRLMLTGLAMGAVLFCAYFPTWADLVNTWVTVTDYHHGFFVIPLVIYFLWVRRDSIPRNISGLDKMTGFLLGLSLIGLSAGARYIFMIYSMTSMDAWTILAWLFGVVLLFYGVRVFLWAAPSLLFLAFMFPWPDSLEIMLRRQLQGIAAKLSACVLNILGEHAISINNTIWLDDIQLDVAAACSGIRILISIIAAAYAVSLLMRRPWWQNTIMFCLAVPVALLMNAFRIATTGLLVKYAYHTVESFGFKKSVFAVCDEISGNIMLVAAFFLFILIVYYIGKVFQKVTPGEELSQ